MDSIIAAAARALADGDALGTLKLVALRDDAPALALRGVAIAQLGDYALVAPAAPARSARRSRRGAGKWAMFLVSLKSLVETGQGAPHAHDVKIDNCN